MRLPLLKIAEVVGAPDNLLRDVTVTGYSIDSRTAKPGELFFAVQGERLDGHDYVAGALAAGAVAAVVARAQAARFADVERLLVVEDTLVALQTLATAVRKLWGGKLVAVTGSAGKTTTKDSIACLLSTSFRVLKSEGNLNNHFGLPLQLLKLESEHEIAVVEMGMSHSGEIAALTRIAQPDIGLVTCVAPVHLGYFQSVAEIARAKYELIQGLPAGATAVLNADDEYVSQFGRDFPGRVVTFALHRPADVRAESVHQIGAAGSTFNVVVGNSSLPSRLPLLGEHNIYNALAAVAVAVSCGVPPATAAASLALLTPSDKRGQVFELAGVTVIDDCYNSNPKALDSMVDTLAAMHSPSAGASSRSCRRIVVAGEMLELGPATEELHRQSARHMAERKIDFLIGVRGAARAMVESATAAGMEALYVETPEEAGAWLTKESRPGDIVLLKASRGVHLERALETWRSWQGAQIS